MPLGHVETGFQAGFDGGVTEYQVEALTRLTRRGQSGLPAAWLDVPLPCWWVGRVWGSVYLAWNDYPCRGPSGPGAGVRGEEKDQSGAERKLN